MLRTATVPTCHFIITLTTHTPYTQLRPDDREIFPHPRTTVEHYLNNMRYLDNCLRDYVTALGKGVTIMIYADHPTTRLHAGPLGKKHEYIPCFIYDTDRDLSRLQLTRSANVSRGRLNIIDVVDYLRGPETLASAGRPPDRVISDSSPMVEIAKFAVAAVV